MDKPVNPEAGFPIKKTPMTNSTTDKYTNNTSSGALLNYEEVLSSAAARLAPLSEEEVAMLSSLPQRPIANFPSEADRKRIVGCLAAIISMMYDYDTWDPRCPCLVGDYRRHDARLEEVECSTNTVDLDSAFEDCTQLSYCNNHSPAKCDNNQEGGRGWRRRREGGEMNAEKKPYNRDNEQNKPRQTRTEKILLILQRHRRRRYSVFMKFLEDTADLLFLEKCNAIAFLPMLNSLLEENSFQNENGISIRTRNGRKVEDKHTNSRTLKESSYGQDSAIGKDRSREESDDLLRAWNLEYDIQGNGEMSRSSSSNTSQRITTSDNNSFTIYSSETSSMQSRPDFSCGPAVARNEQYHGGGISNGLEMSDVPLQTWDKNELIQPFLESLTPGAGFQCVALLLTNHLLRSSQGYDARIRHALKKLGVVVIVHELKQKDYDDDDDDDDHSTSASGAAQDNDDKLVERATRKFEAMEHSIAVKLLIISAAQEQQQKKAEKENSKNCQTKKRSFSGKKDSLLRGLKVGGIGVAAGALFALTGGMAAPGIAAGLAASGLTATAVVTTLTSTAAVTTIFGVGGGGLVAYKTHRRTKGLTDFMFQREKQSTSTDFVRKQSYKNDAELFTTVCLSGWLKDKTDFQRAWGVNPTNPPISDRTEKLARFYSIYKPENVHRSQDILKKWKGDERQLWAILIQKYGRDPDHLLPLSDGPRIRASLTHEEEEALDNLLIELGYILPLEDESQKKAGSLSDMLNEATTPSGHALEKCNISLSFESHEENPKKTPKKITMTAWDYHADYGGELYTVRWESDLLIELCDSVSDMAVDLAGNAAKEILKQTALATLITAITIPYALVRAANMIDGTWTLAIERADLAGIELARSLLESKAGHRPVVLLGFSMGSRAIYSCLKELARHQELWEDQQENNKDGRDVKKHRRREKISKNDKLVYTREPASIIEDAILMGTPNHLNMQSWEACRCVVAGRLVNCYSKNDLILSLMFQINRLSGALRPVCGTSAVNVPGVENYDVSPFISAHSDYCTMVGFILRLVRHGCPHRPTSTIVIPDNFVEKNSTSTGES